MISQIMGDVIDIHGGGRDLVFPHHENELAQSQVSRGVDLRLLAASVITCQANRRPAECNGALAISPATCPIEEVLPCSFSDIVQAAARHQSNIIVLLAIPH